jgi:hypothetical protein
MVVKACIKACGRSNVEDVCLVLINSTKDLDEIYMSEAALTSVTELQAVSKVGEFMEIPFDEDGNLTIFEHRYDSLQRGIAHTAGGS